MERLKETIETRAFVRGKDEPIAPRGSGTQNRTGWLFDIRRILLEPSAMEDIATLFWKTFPEKTPLQIGGLESGAIPLLSNLVAYAHYREDREDVSGFFIRKSRKKDGLMRALEGTLHKDRRIILVDDLLNSGRSFIQQVEVLESLGHRIDALWVLVRFRDEAYYQYFNEKGIPIHSLFTLDDFADTLDIHNLEQKEPPPPAPSFRFLWKFGSPNPSYHYVVPKSDPALDDERVYVGADIGVMYAINQADGSLAWSHQIGFHAKGKGIFSSPAVHDGVVYFGGYDGNTYALDAKSGKKKWVSFEADWVGSSPALAPDLGLVFIGLEYGLWRKRGGIAALDMNTGKTIWAYRDMPCYTHASPLYIALHREVVIGSNDGCVYLFDAKKGALIWKFEPAPLAEQELNTGFSHFDIKGRCAYDEKRDLIIALDTDGDVTFLDRKTGQKQAAFKAEYGFYSSPVIYKDTVLVSSLDKNLYCINLDTFQEKWRWMSGARIFATPVLIDGSIYMGSNTGRLTELDPETGAEKSFVTLTERITNRTAYNPRTQRYFIPTFANQLYCAEKISPLEKKESRT